MSRSGFTRSTLIAAVLILLGAGLITVGATGWGGPAAATLTIVAVFLGPGLGWQNLRGRLDASPERIGLAVTVSVGTVIVLGFAMNAASVGLTRSHWADALAAVILALAIVTLVRPPEAAQATASEEDAYPTRRFTGAIVGLLCAGLAAAGGAIAWSSQQHLLNREHYTELYAIATHGGEEVRVHNEEGKRVTYLARIAAAGQPVSLMQFTLGAGATWRRTVGIEPSKVRPGQPLLEVELGRDGVRGLYRWIRVLRPQPPASSTN